MIGHHGIFSTPAVSCIIRKRSAEGWCFDHLNINQLIKYSCCGVSCVSVQFFRVVSLHYITEHQFVQFETKQNSSELVKVYKIDDVSRRSS